jgi:hypothetical protein
MLEVRIIALDQPSGWKNGHFFRGKRHEGGTCIACFRPALVNNGRKGSSISIIFENALAVPEIREL